jgi:hypothetical protein
VADSHPENEDGSSAAVGLVSDLAAGLAGGLVGVLALAPGLACAWTVSGVDAKALRMAERARIAGVICVFMLLFFSLYLEAFALLVGQRNAVIQG